MEASALLWTAFCWPPFCAGLDHFGALADDLPKRWLSNPRPAYFNDLFLCLSSVLRCKICSLGCVMKSYPAYQISSPSLSALSTASSWRFRCYHHNYSLISRSPPDPRLAHLRDLFSTFSPVFPLLVNSESWIQLSSPALRCTLGVLCSLSFWDTHGAT